MAAKVVVKIAVIVEMATITVAVFEAGESDRSFIEVTVRRGRG